MRKKAIKYSTHFCKTKMLVLTVILSVDKHSIEYKKTETKEREKRKNRREVHLLAVDSRD